MQKRKRKKRLSKIAGIVDTGLITSAAITGGVSVAPSATVVGLPVGIILGGITIVFLLVTIAIRTSFKTLTLKQKKLDSIKLFVQNKLDSIVDIISQAIRDEDISPAEFHKVLKEVEKYHKLKADIRNQAKAKVKQIMKEQLEEILGQGRKKGEKSFLQKISNTSGTQGVSAIQNMRLLRLTTCNFMIYKRL